MNIFFPQVSGSSLAGEHFDFPASLGADLTLAVISFWDWQQPMADSWIEEAAPLERQAPQFEYLEMPVIEQSSPEAERFIYDGMREGITDRIAREKTVPLYLDKRDFMRCLGLPTEDEVYAILMGPSGLIMRMWAGSATPNARRQLQELVWTAAAVA